jgi:hypothetical protein
MQRLTASFFLFIFLFANTALRELAKIDAFISHYAEHKANDQEITVLEFIAIHYFSGNIVDDDYSRDMQLPFKTTDCNSPIPSIVIALPDFPDLKICAIIESGLLPLYDQSLLPSLHTDDIWQPPKSC